MSTRFSLSMEMSRLTRDGTAETVSRDQILRHEHGQGNINFSCSADREQDWQPYSVDPYSAICVTIHTHILSPRGFLSFRISDMPCFGTSQRSEVGARSPQR